MVSDGRFGGLGEEDLVGLLVAAAEVELALDGFEGCEAPSFFWTTLRADPEHREDREVCLGSDFSSDFEEGTLVRGDGSENLELAVLLGADAGEDTVHVVPLRA